MKNNFLYWHTELERKLNRRISISELATGFGVDKNNLSRYLKSGTMPDSSVYHYKAWIYFRQYFPDIHMEDLITIEG
jgi:hypothetical protein